MDNIEKLIKNADDIKIGKKEQYKLIEIARKAMGSNTYLSLCMEEIAELVEVIVQSYYNINTLKKLDYFHIAEEIADVEIGTMIISHIVNKSELKTDKVKIDKKDSFVSWSKVCDVISNLSKSQQYISKYIRKKSGSKEKIQKAIIMMLESTAKIKLIYNIDEKDIKKIKKLKFNRMKMESHL